MTTPMTEVQAPARPARLAVRQHARRMLRDPLDASAHLARLQAALELPGSEPVQGALADLFVAFGEREVLLKRSALQLARDRLAEHVVRWFEAQAGQARLSRITPLATRWSVLARPSADISTRARRCSGDDSRALADQAVKAVENADAKAQAAFLHHCITCHDNLAFMLARRALLRESEKLPPNWDEVSRQLQQIRDLA
jgi:mono/diheme cytochrome c family protein